MALDMEEHLNIAKYKKYIIAAIYIPLSLREYILISGCSHEDICFAETGKEESFAEIFSRGIMLPPEVQYIFDATSAATKILKLMNGSNPRKKLCYLPSRYYW